MTGERDDVKPFDLRELDTIDFEDDDAEAAFELYLGRMLDSFNASDEGRALPAMRDAKENGWDALRMIDFGWNEIGATPATMSRDELAEILTGIFPRNMILDDPADAATIIPELRAFWQWAGRANGLGNAADMLGLLDELEREYPAMMNDPARYSPQKAVVLLGIEAGYDMHDPEQSQAFIDLFEAAVARDTAAAAASIVRAAQKKYEAKAKQKRKMEKASRKRNRRK